MTVNFDDAVTIKKGRKKMGISGKAVNIKSLSVNGQAISVRPDNKLYVATAKYNLEKSLGFTPNPIAYKKW